ncbi:uncharacterized protein BDZ99DRAFT_493302 [Mytilinidion resinicola]|uniref:Uncharacterized protein n=1 Tax=Mytilinidion resinicola TaxID=574789 RepID=A0A6A6Z9X7_9PEZI|nr:uncharacterized protein BDZ99DRAFT_493302 [Mytilinidion resinicola]KAF2817499.1 hypothetical protein BDZ99DRAFT_493302 [Mytilinidion resinicola]
MNRKISEKFMDFYDVRGGNGFIDRLCDARVEEKFGFRGPRLGGSRLKSLKTPRGTYKVPTSSVLIFLVRKRPTIGLARHLDALWTLAGPRRLWLTLAIPVALVLAFLAYPVSISYPHDQDEEGPRLFVKKPANCSELWKASGEGVETLRESWDVVISESD